MLVTRHGPPKTATNQRLISMHLLNTWANGEDDDSKTGERITQLSGYRFQVKVVSQSKVIAWILGASCGLGFAKRFGLKFGDASNFADNLVQAEASISFLLEVHRFMFRTAALRNRRKYLSGVAFEMYSAVEDEIQSFLRARKVHLSAEAYEKTKYYKTDIIRVANLHFLI